MHLYNGCARAWPPPCREGPSRQELREPGEEGTRGQLGAGPMDIVPRRSRAGRARAWGPAAAPARPEKPGRGWEAGSARAHNGPLSPLAASPFPGLPLLAPRFWLPAPRSPWGRCQAGRPRPVPVAPPQPLTEPWPVHLSQRVRHAGLVAQESREVHGPAGVVPRPRLHLAPVPAAPLVGQEAQVSVPRGRELPVGLGAGGGGQGRGVPGGVR